MTVMGHGPVRATAPIPAWMRISAGLGRAFAELLVISFFFSCRHLALRTMKAPCMPIWAWPGMGQMYW